jgi:hypothetical protein
MFKLLLLLCFGGSVKDLSHNDYVVRERAEQRLTKYSWLTWQICEKKFNNLEAKTRAKRVVNSHLRIPNAIPLPFLLGQRPYVEWIYYDEELKEFVKIQKEYPERQPKGFMYSIYYFDKSHWTFPLLDYLLKQTDSWVLDSTGSYMVVCPDRARDATALVAEKLMRVGMPRTVCNYLFAEE